MILCDFQEREEIDLLGAIVEAEMPARRREDSCSTAASCFTLGFRIRASVVRRGASTLAPRLGKVLQDAAIAIRIGAQQDIQRGRIGVGVYSNT